MNFSIEIVPAILGLIGGLLATFTAPWIQWGVDKRRFRMENRRAKIDRWRSAIHSAFLAREWSEPGEREWELFQCSEIVELKTILSGNTRHALGSESFTDEEVLDAILDDIERQERRWYLI